METKWHYVKNGTERFGPIPEPELMEGADQEANSLFWLVALPPSRHIRILPRLPPRRCHEP